MATRTLGNLTLYYEDSGTGSPVVLLHGSLCRGPESFTALAAALQNAGFRTFCPDQRGHGRTACPEKGWTLRQLADDVPAFLDSLGIQQAHLIGHSMGADAAMMAALYHPDRFATLTAISSTGIPGTGFQDLLKRFDPDGPQAGRYHHYTRELAEKHMAAWGGDWWGQIQVNIRNVSSAPQFSDDDLRQIALPFLLLYGAQDPFMQGQDVGRLARCCPDFRFRAVPACRHTPHEQQEGKKLCAREIISFLQAHPIHQPVPSDTPGGPTHDKACPAD